MRRSPLVESLAGIDNDKFAAVTVVAPNVPTMTAFFPAAVSLYSKKVSKEVESVTVVHEKEADGVQKAVVPVNPTVLPLVTATPAAVYPVPETSEVAL